MRDNRIIKTRLRVKITYAKITNSYLRGEGAMKRKIYEELKKWKREENGRTALLIDGARRVGKSYID